MATNQGRDTRSLTILAVKLAREWFFLGDNLMATASPSGKGAPGQVLVQLEPQLMRQIKALIRQRTRFLSEGEFATIGLFIELLPCARAQLARQPAS